MYGVLEALEIPKTDDCIVHIGRSETADNVGSSDTPGVNDNVGPDLFTGEKARHKKAMPSKSMSKKSKKIAKRHLAAGVERGRIRGRRLDEMIANVVNN